MIFFNPVIVHELQLGVGVGSGVGVGVGVGVGLFSFSPLLNVTVIVIPSLI